MSEISQATRELFETLKTERDEIKMQIHLASMDVKDRIKEDWEAGERKLAQLKASAKRTGHEIGEILDDVDDSMEDVADDIVGYVESIIEDIRERYVQIRHQLKKPD